MSNRGIPLSQALATTGRDEELVNVTMTFRQLRIIIGQLRGSYRYAIKAEAKDRRKRGGQSWQEATGKVNVRDVVKERIRELEQRLCKYADVESAFDDKGNFFEGR